MCEILNMQCSSVSNDLHCFVTVEADVWQPRELRWMFNEPKDRVGFKA